MWNLNKYMLNILFTPGACSSKMYVCYGGNNIQQNLLFYSLNMSKQAILQTLMQKVFNYELQALEYMVGRMKTAI